MGKGGGGGGLSEEVQQGMMDNQSALVTIAQGQAENANKLFETGFPGVKKAEDWYTELSTGDPTAIMQAISPATQKISEGTSGAIKNIQQNAPAGGEKNLAIEMAQANEGAQVGATATNAFLGSHNALAALGGQNIGESIQSASTGIQGISAADQGLAQLGDLQNKKAELAAQQKGNQLGAFTSLASTGAELGMFFA